MSTQLLVSLSGIRDGTLDDCAALIADLDARRVPASLLVVPRDLGGSAAVRWIRERRDQGDAVLMHGYDHTADPLGAWGSYTVARVGRRAEFATLPAHEAGLRLHAANVLLERQGLGTDTFVPPRWLASAGTVRALHHRGYRVCADATAVHVLRLNQVHRGRVLGFRGLGLSGLGLSGLGLSGLGRGGLGRGGLGRGGLGRRGLGLGGLGRSGLGLANGERTWCQAMVLAAARTARRGGLVRLAVDAADLAHSGRRCALLDAVDIALHHRARPCTYPALSTQPVLAA